MRKLVALSTAIALTFAQTPAQASPACDGCNLIDEGTFSAGLVGQTVYHGVTAVTVSAVDTSLRRVYWRDGAGQAWWAAANTLYSPRARSERNNNYALGAVAVGVLWCLAGGCSGGERDRAAAAPPTPPVRHGKMRRRPGSTIGARTTSTKG